MNTPETIVAMMRPMYVNLAMNRADSSLFFGLRGGVAMIPFSGSSTPRARAGNRSVPTFTERMRTAVSGAGRFAMTAKNTVASSPILHEKI